MDDGGVDGFNEASVIKSGRGRGQGRMDGWMDGGVIGALALPAVQSLRTNQRYHAATRQSRTDTMHTSETLHTHILGCGAVMLLLAGRDGCAR